MQSFFVVTFVYLRDIIVVTFVTFLLLCLAKLWKNYGNNHATREGSQG